jgi:hypothetical protein
VNRNHIINYCITTNDLIISKVMDHSSGFYLTDCANYCVGAGFCIVVLGLGGFEYFDSLIVLKPFFFNLYMHDHDG